MRTTGRNVDTALALAGAVALAAALAGCFWGYPPNAAREQADGGTKPPPVTIQKCKGLCTDFPTAPIITGGAPANAPSMFTAAGTAAGPCISEPEDGTLLPNNWLRPRVKVSAAGASLLQITFHSDKEANDLVVYTAGDSWAMDKTIWQKHRHPRRRHGDHRLGARARRRRRRRWRRTSSFTIAPVAAGGKMVYWALRGYDASIPTNTELFGFGVGDEHVVSVLQGAAGAADHQRRVGELHRLPHGDARRRIRRLHRQLPVGQRARVGAVGRDRPDADVPRQRGREHADPGLPRHHQLLGRALGRGRSHRDHVAEHAAGRPRRQPDLDGARLRRVGNASRARRIRRAPRRPSFSHDGTKIVYTSTNANQDGRLGVGTADLYTVPYGNRNGGTARPIAGASDPGFAEYYPAFSPDDELVAFNRLPQSDANVTPTGQPYDGGMFFNPAAEVWVVPAAGGSAIRLRANDPPSCTPPVLPNTRVYPNKTGWDNSWAKWSPDVGTYEDRKFYWMVFSSYRYDISPPRGQLYMTAVVTSETQTSTYPAVYLWNQDLTTSNHTPSWEAYQIPIVP